MKFEIIVLGITGLLIANAYYDGKYLKLLYSWKKYYQMAFIGFMGLSVYWFMKQHPQHSPSLVASATNFIKHMPLDRETSTFLTPIINSYPIMSQQTQGQFYSGGTEERSKKRMNQSGKTTKRSVSETKKKYVASQQQWHCGDCKNQLSAWFEVDHKIRLDQGGTNAIP